MVALTTVMKLLESANRGDLLQAFHRKMCPAIDKNNEKGKYKDDNKDHSNDVTKGSQDESWVNRYLNTSLIYTDPSLFRPWGVFESLMPRGYIDSFRNYDGLDISSGSAAELFFRTFNGRKIKGSV